jgi:hypothetical protein
MGGTYGFGADPIERIIDYIASSDPAFRSGIRGASEEEIDWLQQLTGGPLPAVYRSFLRHMGHGMDWIVAYDGNFDIGRVISFYERALWTVPSEHWLIAVPRSESSSEIYLRQEASAAIRVVSIPAAEEEVDESALDYFAGSLEELIGRAAFWTLTIAVAPFTTRLYHPDPESGSAPLVQEYAQRVGMSPEWFSNDWTTVCTGPETNLVATKTPHRNLVVDCAADTAEAHAVMVQSLERQFGLLRAAAIPL